MKLVFHSSIWRYQLWKVGLLALADLLFFGLTNPARVPAYLIVVGFGLLGLSLMYGLKLVQQIASVYSPWLGRQRYLSRTIAITLALLLALQSIGELTSRDFLLIPLAATAIYVYIGIIKKAPR